ncbi:MAG: hypothetical protein ACFFCS_01060 [Candidatus Hodarchaeota archaeon]
MENDSEKLEFSEKPEEINYWEVIGVHRAHASFWQMYLFIVISAVPAIIVFAWLLPNVILPFPSALGFQALTVNFFGMFFTIMDVATGPACERYVAQYADINPKKALQYIQFFIWFQMFTGVIQMTGVSIYCFWFMPRNLEYAMWFFLVYSCVQFPGMLGAYGAGLRGFQRFNKANNVMLIQTILFETVTQVVFILIGRWLGALNPAIGEVVGCTIGFIIGRYLDDFIAMLLAAYYMGQVLKPHGIRIRETIIPGFSRAVARESLVYGLKLLGAPVISALTDFMTLWMMITWLPNYVFIVGIVELARTIASAVGITYNYGPLISEAYNNGKKKLAQYSITHYWNSWWNLGFFLALQLTIIVPSVLEKLGGNFAFTATIIPIYILPRLLVTPAGMGATVCQSIDKPDYRTWGIVSEKFTKMLTVYLFLSPWFFRKLFGETSLLTLYILHDIPAYVVISFLEFGLANRHVKIKINIWQCFIAGSLCSVPTIPISMLMVNLFNASWTGMDDLVLPLVIVAITLLMLLFLFPVIVFFFYGLFGGFDKRGLEHFGNAVKICGPSRFIVNFFYKGAELGFKLSPLKYRFRTPWEEADKELDELIALQEAQEKA